MRKLDDSSSSSPLMKRMSTPSNNYLQHKTYTSLFVDIYKETDNSKVYVSDKIESAKVLGELKHGSRYYKLNIFNTLVKNNAFLSHKQFKSYEMLNIIF